MIDLHYTGVSMCLPVNREDRTKTKHNTSRDFEGLIHQSCHIHLHTYNTYVWKILRNKSKVQTTRIQGIKLACYDSDSRCVYQEVCNCFFTLSQTRWSYQGKTHNISVKHYFVNFVNSTKNNLTLYVCIRYCCVYLWFFFLFAIERQMSILLIE